MQLFKNSSTIQNPTSNSNDITIDEYWRLRHISKEILKLCARENRCMQLLRYGRSYGLQNKTIEKPKRYFVVTIGNYTEKIECE